MESPDPRLEGLGLDPPYLPSFMLSARVPMQFSMTSSRDSRGVETTGGRYRSTAELTASRRNGPDDNMAHVDLEDGEGNNAGYLNVFRGAFPEWIDDVEEWYLTLEFEYDHEYALENGEDEAELLIADDHVRSALPDVGVDCQWSVSLPGTQPRIATSADGTLYATVGNDYSDPGGSTLVALDLETGETEWNSEVPKRIVCAPVAAGETIFATDLNGVVYAVDPDTGEKRWTTDLAPFATVRLPNVQASPTVDLEARDDEGGRVYVAEQNGSDAFALSARTGEVQFSETVVKKLMASPVVAAEAVILGTGWDRDFLTALDPESGDQLWTLDVDADWVALHDGVAFVPGDDLLGIDPATGERLWSVDATASATTERDGLVYVTGSEGVFVVDPATGDVPWGTGTTPGTAPAGVDETGASSSSVSVDFDRVTEDGIADATVTEPGDDGSIGATSGVPVVEDDTVYATGGETVYAIDRETGLLQWRRSLSNPSSSFEFAVADDRVYVGTDTIYALDAADGQLCWTRELGSSVSSLVTRDETVVAVTTDGTVAAFRGSPGTQFGGTAVLETADDDRRVALSLCEAVAADSGPGDDAPRCDDRERLVYDRRYVPEYARESGSRLDLTVAVSPVASRAADFEQPDHAAGFFVDPVAGFSGTLVADGTDGDFARIELRDPGSDPETGARRGELVVDGDRIPPALSAGEECFVAVRAVYDHGATAAARAPEYPYERHDSEGDPATTARIRWSASVEGDVEGTAATDGTVAVATDRQVYGFDAADGERRWSVDLDSPLKTSPVAGDGVVYCTDRSDTLYAISAADGTVRWTFEAPTGFYDALAVYGDRVYAGAEYGSETELLFVVDATDGTLLWTSEAPRDRDCPAPKSIALAALPDGTDHEDGESRPSSEGTGNADPTAFVGERSGSLLAVDGDEVRWETYLPHPAPSSVMDSGSPDGRRLFLGGDGGYVSAFDAASGELCWRTDARPDEFPKSVDVALADGVLVATSPRGGDAWGLDPATGDRLWRFGHGGGLRTAVEPVATGGRVHVADATAVYALDPDDGRLLWRHRLGDRTRSVSAADGVVYAATGDGEVVALVADDR